MENKTTNTPPEHIIHAYAAALIQHALFGQPGAEVYVYMDVHGSCLPADGSTASEAVMMDDDGCLRHPNFFCRVLRCGDRSTLEVGNITTPDAYAHHQLGVCVLQHVATTLRKMRAQHSITQVKTDAVVTRPWLLSVQRAILEQDVRMTGVTVVAECIVIVL
jgi:hypothetical protein